jgi:hypothetical protein
VLAFAVIGIGIVAALCIALFPVHSGGTQRGVEGCGDAAAAIVLNGEGAHVQIGGPRHGRIVSSACYRTAEKRMVVAGVVLVAPFAIVLIVVYRSRRKMA